MKRLVLIAVCLAALAAGGYLALLPRPAGGPLTIGLIASLSGRYAALSASGRDGALMAVEHVNARGGVAGRSVILSVHDDAFDAAKAAQAVDELAAQGAAALVGPFASAMAESVLQAASRKNMLVLSPTVATDALSGMDDLFLRLIPTASQLARDLGRRVGERGIVSVQALTDTANDSFTAPFALWFAAGFKEAGGRDFAVIPFDSREKPSFQELTARALAARPGGVLAVASPLDTALICQRTRLADQEVALFSAAWGMSADLVANGGKAVEGIESVTPMDVASTSQAWLDFARDFQHRFGRQPDFAALFNYEAVLLLAQTLADDPTARGERLKRLILAQTSHAGLQGSYSFDANGDVRRPTYLITVRGGRLVRPE